MHTRALVPGRGLGSARLAPDDVGDGAAARAHLREAVLERLGRGEVSGAAVAQAGVLDLEAAVGLGGGAVTDFLGADPDEVPDADPVRLLPLDVPVRCVHGRDDDIVPIEQSRSYVDAATAAGTDATLVPVEGDHFVVIDPSSAAWTRPLEVLADL